MLYSALALISLAVLIGFYLLTYILQNKNTPKGIVFTHGPLAGTGLILLIIYAILYKPAPILGIIVLALAAVGGMVLISQDLLGKSPSKFLALTHGLTALIGFSFILFFVFFS